MRCTVCLTANPDANRFCGHCGASLAGHHRVESEPPPRPATGWGELKQATVLFADVVNSTEQIAELDPEGAMDRLQPAMLRMCEAVERFGGTVVRTLGDGILALFGVPQALEGHARLACEAALSMQEAFAADPLGTQIRIGLHCGLVASDPAHGNRNMGAHGLTIHLASRVVGEAEPGGICLSADCRALVNTSYEFVPLGFRRLKGVAQPVELFGLGARAAGAGNPQFQQVSLSPFLGRDAEMAILQQALDSARQDLRVIGIAGAPGAGKSRLCHEFANACRARGLPVHEIRTQLYGHARPLQAMLELLRNYFFRILPNDDILVARSRVAQRLDEAGLRSNGDLALVFELLGLVHADAPPSQVNPRVRHARLLHIMRELFRHAAARPSVLIIEDLHWLDEASEEFVSALVDAAEGTQGLLLLNYRPSYLAPWKSLAHFRELELSELSAEQTLALAQALLAVDAFGPDICRLVAQRSGGNPFFAEELARSLHDSGWQTATESTQAQRLALAERVLPSSVQALIGARVDLLEEGQKAVLQMCAVVGKEVPLGVLQRLAGLEPRELSRTLDALCRVALVQPQVGSDGRSFAFRHPMIQEVTYGMQLKARRANLHAEVANAMQAHYRDQLDEYAGLIGHHYEAAGQAPDAARHLARAARWVGAHDSARAIKHWQRVWDLLDVQAQAPELDRLRALAGSQIATLGWREGMSLQVVQPFIDQARRLAEGVDSRLSQYLLAAEGRMLQSTGAPADGYVERVVKALSLLPQGVDPGREAMLNAALCQAYGWAGLVRLGLAASDVALAGVDQLDRFDREFLGFDVRQWVLSMRGRLLVRRGEFAQAQACWSSLQSSPESPLDPALQIICHLGQVELAWFLKDVARGREHAERVRELAGKYPIPYVRAIADFCAAMSLATAGELESAITAYGTALNNVRSAGVAVELEAETLAGLADCHRRHGDLRLARQIASEAIELARQRSARLSQCHALIILGTVLAALGEPMEGMRAEDCLERARDLIRDTGATAYELPLRLAFERLALARTAAAPTDAGPAR